MPPEENTFYVATTGLSTNDGSISSPWDLQTALDGGNGEIVPGDTVLIRGGTYSDVYSIKISGTKSYPILFMNYLDERVTIDGQLRSDWASHVWVRGQRGDLEIYDAGFTDRVSEQTGGSPTDVNGIGPAAYLNGHGLRLINAIVHDAMQGIVSSSAAHEIEAYGCLIFYCGWQSPVNSYGHGVYPQNDGGAPKVFKENSVFDNFGVGFHLYGSQGLVTDFVLIGNTVFNNGSPLGGKAAGLYLNGSEPNENTIWAENMTYYSPGGPDAGTNDMGDPDNSNINLQVYDNYFANDLTYVFRLFGSVNDIARLDGNTFIGATLGFDTGVWVDNTHVASGYPVSGTKIFLRANEYDSNLANLIIYNWSGGDTVQIDVSSVFNIGDTINAHNVQDYFVDIQELTVAGDGTLTVNMQAVNRTVATPVGWSAPATVFPDFGCFRLVRQ